MRSTRFIFVAIFLTSTAIASPTGPTTKPSDVAATQPSWLPLGGWAYQERDVEWAEKRVLSFEAHARWFMGYGHPVSKREFDEYVARQREARAITDKFDIGQPDGRYSLPSPLPYPRTLNDLPLSDRGVTLSFHVGVTPDPNVLGFEIILASSRRPVWREVEHRSTDVVPLLFAVYIDGKLPHFSSAFEKMGGSRRSIELIRVGGGQRKWSLKVNAESLKKILPDDEPHAVMIIAAFSERQRMPFLDLDSLEWDQFVDGRELLTPAGHDGPQVLVRSNAAEIRWAGSKWETPKADSPGK